MLFLWWLFFHSGVLFLYSHYVTCERFSCMAFFPLRISSIRFKWDFLAFFLASFSNPLVILQAALGSPAITLAIPSPTWSSTTKSGTGTRCGCCLRPLRTVDLLVVRFLGPFVLRLVVLRFLTDMIKSNSVKSPFLSFFEVQRDNGMAVTKLDQVSSGTNRFRYLNMNNFHDFVTKR